MEQEAIDVLGPLPEIDHGNNLIAMVHFRKWPEANTLFRIRKELLLLTS